MVQSPQFVVIGDATTAGIAIVLLEGIGNSARDGICHGALHLGLVSLEFVLGNIGSKGGVRCGSIHIDHRRDTGLELLLVALEFINFGMKLLVECCQAIFAWRISLFAARFFFLLSTSIEGNFLI